MAIVGPFSPKKKIPLDSLQHLSSDSYFWSPSGKNSPQKKEKRKRKPHIGDDARRRLQHMVSSAITMFQRFLKHS
jgi:hypothetical protein